MSWSFKLHNKTKAGIKKALDVEAAKPHCIPHFVADQIKAAIDKLPDDAGIFTVETSGHIGGAGSYDSTHFSVGTLFVGE